jgi:uncharacterized protein with HEPN domain
MPKRSTLADDLYRVEHMISFCEKIIQFAKEDIKEDSELSEMRILALLRLFETLGEAASKVGDESRARFPDVPWVEASDMRNRLIHGYDDLDMSILWYTAEHNIPPLLEQLLDVRNILRSENQ